MTEQFWTHAGGMIVRVYPESVPDISATATALADASRAAMCAALMDGRAWTVGELGNYAVELIGEWRASGGVSW